MALSTIKRLHNLRPETEGVMKKNKPVESAVMFLDQGFGTLRLARERQPVTLAGIDLAPGTSDALTQIKAAGARTILILPEPLPREALQALKQYLPEIDRVIAYEKDIARTLDACAKKLSIELLQSVFVAADRVARGAAARRVSFAAPHPAIAALAVRGRSLHFVRATGDREHFERISEVIPYFAEYSENGRWSLLAVMSREAIAEAISRRFRVESLPLDLPTEDPLFVQFDDIDARAAEELSKQKTLLAEGARTLVALGPRQANDSLPIHGPHGHFQFLMPSPELLGPAPAQSSGFRTARLALGRLPLDKIEVAKPPLDIDILDLILSPCPSTAASFQADVDRYSGVSDLGGSGPIASRHIQHPDNSRVVQALIDELNSIGYCAYTHTFTHAGLTLRNVIADLPGRGFFRLDPDILERVREIFLKHPLPDPPDPWVKAVTRLVGGKWFEGQNFGGLSPLRMRAALEAIFELRPWFPWWFKLCPLAGPGAEIVIVGCHLDSTAARTVGYNPATDPAPGTDDDATGIASTLALARYLWGFRGRLPHTVRFCFFNTEEQGLVGSKAYAAMLKAAGAPIKAVVCADMIGYNSDAERIFEVHAGFTDAAVRDLSVPIADKIASWAACLGALAPAQIYKGTSSASGADRNLYDGAINRSDHGAFHQQGYPAVVVSEDFFVNLAAEPGADPNPNYHEGDDTVIDSAYASDITCAIAFAVKELAGG
jgi:Peptidase family M28